MFGKTIMSGLLALAIVASAIVAQADVFNMGGARNADGSWTGLASLEMVTVGNQDNTGEWSGESYGGLGPDPICGAVGYTYQIGKYEVTAGQYTDFLNAKAATDLYGLYNTAMWSSDYGCKIERSGSEGGYSYSVASDWANRPVNYVSFWDAARFTNWLNNGQGDNDTETGAYTLNGYNGDDGHAISRNAGATWFLPSENEWYKAAYHKNDGATGNYWDYPTGSDSDPSNDLINPDPGNNANFWDGSSTIGSPYCTTVVGEFENSESSYGTFDQGGNLWEWNEAVVYVWDRWSRGVRGGDWISNSGVLLASYRNSCDGPATEGINKGFRVASVPEPGSLIMTAMIAVSGLLYYWRRHV